jgi:hypothetical protein
MPIVTACPKCQTKYQLPEMVVGKTIECQKCSHKFTATELRQPISSAATTAGQPAVKTSAASVRLVPGATAEELAKFGLDGPILRPPDLLSDNPSPPPKDILGNFAADPGFAAAQASEKSRKRDATTEGLESIIANPYANQSRSLVPVTDLSKAPGVGFASLMTCAKVAIASFGVAIASLLVIAGIWSYLTYLFWDHSAGLAAPIDQDRFGKLMIASRVAGYTFLASILSYTFALSMFSFQGYENFRAMGTKELTFGSVLAAFCWWIPLANWVLPALIVAELSRASRKPIADQWRGMSASVKVWVWWGLLCAVWIGPIALGAFIGIGQLAAGSLDSISEALLLRSGIYWGFALLFIGSVFVFASLGFEIAANQDKAWPVARKNRQGTGKPAPKPIPYVFSAVALIVLAIAMAVGSTILIIRGVNAGTPTTMDYVVNFGLGGILGGLAVASLVFGVIHSIKMFR